MHFNQVRRLIWHSSRTVDRGECWQLDILRCAKFASGKRGHIVADTLLPTQMFPCLPAGTTFVADTNFVSGTQKNVSDFVQKDFVSATNVSAAMCPRLPGPLT